jgi:hypothetical protein
MARDQLDIAFGSWVTRRFAPEIESYSDILLNRIDPIFEDVDGEAHRAMDGFIASMSSRAREEDYDDVVQAAYDHAQETALQFTEMRAVFLTTGVSGLFHLFERQLYLHINKELRDWLTGPVALWRDLQDLIPRFDNKWHEDSPCMDFIDAFNDPDLRELRLVANTVKHGGDGSSYKQLVNMRAAVVDRQRVKDEFAGPDTVLGVAIAVQRADVERYRKSILRFWRLNGTFWAPRSAFK